MPKSEFAPVDLWSTTENHILLPGFTNASGVKGKLQGLCSNEWKKRVVQRKCRALGLTSVLNWIGISVDEMGRVRQSTELWFQNHYPLIFDVPKRRHNCVDIVRAMGWPPPPRSACWMCSNQGDREWREMKRDYPGDFAKAVTLEREIRQDDPHFFLHESCKPLDEVDFDRQTELFPGRECASGYCFV